MLRGIRTKLASAGHGETRRLEGQHGHAGSIVTYGIDRTHFKRIRKTWAKEVADLAVDDALDVAGCLLSSHVEEEGHLGVSVLRAVVDRLERQDLSRLDDIVSHMSSWSMVDDFATGKASVTAVLLERFPAATLAMHRRWRRSAVAMQRRAGVVTFTRAVAARGDYTEEILGFCEQLQYDAEDLVQKAVGWALKDVMRAGKQARRRAIALIKRMRAAGVPATLTSYAMRDLTKAEKAAVTGV